MTKVTVEPGICGLTTFVEAVADDDKTNVTLKVRSKCQAVAKMMAELGNSFDAYEICLTRPGEGPFFAYASKNFPVHVSCPSIAGIIKCAEVECGLALAKDASIRFEPKDAPAD